MVVKIITSKKFRRKAKPLLKKYRSLKGELKELEDKLLENPGLGISIGKSCYKIKLAVKSKGKGKIVKILVKTDGIARSFSGTIFESAFGKPSICKTYVEDVSSCWEGEIVKLTLTGWNRFTLHYRDLVYESKAMINQINEDERKSALDKL